MCQWLSSGILYIIPSILDLIYIGYLIISFLYSQVHYTIAGKVGEVSPAFQYRSAWNYLAFFRHQLKKYKQNKGFWDLVDSIVMEITRCNRNELGRQLILSTWRPLKIGKKLGCRLLHLILWVQQEGHWSFLHALNYRSSERQKPSVHSVNGRRNDHCELLSLEIWFRRLSLKLEAKTTARVMPPSTLWDQGFCLFNQKYFMPYFFNERMTQEGVGKIDGHQTQIIGSQKSPQDAPGITETPRKAPSCQLDKTRHERALPLSKPLRRLFRKIKEALTAHRKVVRCVYTCGIISRSGSLDPETSSFRNG